MKRLAILLITALLALGSSINAQPARQGMPPNGKPPVGLQPGVPPMQAALNLTDEQVAKINEIRFAHQKAMIDLRSKIQKNRLEAREMIAGNNIDEAKLLSLTEENSKLKGEIATSRTKMWLKIYNSLDDTQKAKWAKMRSYRQSENFARRGGKYNKKGGKRGSRRGGMMNGQGQGQWNNW